MVSQISEVYAGTEAREEEAEGELFALKAIQKPNLQKLDESYLNQKLIFMNDAHVLQSI